jgi:hypothetical protein
MREQDFKHWLTCCYLLGNGAAMDSRSRDSRISNCTTVEKHEDDLDAHFARDQLQGLLDRLRYTKEDERTGSAARHRILIEGNVYNGTNTYRSAIKLYQRFCQSWPVGASAPAPLSIPTSPRILAKREKSSAWPQWAHPTEAQILELARLTVPFVRFVRSEIVRAVVEDNERHRAEWSTRLQARGIDPRLYLWEKSACAFPGVRRYAGSTEIAQYRGRASVDPARMRDHLRLDDNDCPKQLWSFVLRGKPFQKFGPGGYSLAHLADHKNHKNRSSAEFDQIGTNPWKLPLFGLYTSAANTVYLPTTLIKPTDFAGPLRNLLQRRATALYGSYCNLLPPELRIRDAESDTWSLEAFDWSAPVGSPDKIGAFLEFRLKAINELFRE